MPIEEKWLKNKYDDNIVTVPNTLLESVYDQNGKTLKKILEELAEGGVYIPIDGQLDKSSPNAIANSAVALKIEDIEQMIKDMNTYQLPIATDFLLGGVKQGENISIDENGVLSAIVPEKITVDTKLNPTSDNPVANNAIYTEFQELKKEISNIVSYELPPASMTNLGGIKQGEGVFIEADGTLNMNLPTATASRLGGVKIGENIGYKNNTISIPISGPDTLGLIKIGKNLKIDNNGVLDSEIPLANNYTIGGIMVGDNLSIGADGKLKAEIPSAEKISYNDSDTQIGVEDVQSAIEYLTENSGGGSAKDIEYDNSTSSIEANNVQSAIDYLAEHGGGGSGNATIRYNEATDYIQCLLQGEWINYVKCNLKPSVTAKYLRFSVLRNQYGESGAYIAISELKFADSEGNYYIFPSGTIFESNKQTGSYEDGSKMFDNDLNTKWCASFSQPIYTTITQLDDKMIDLKKFNTIELYNAADASSHHERNPRGVKLEMSNDGEKWTEIFTEDNYTPLNEDAKQLSFRKTFEV